mmetsp:Transcript_33038/g.63817  ORF Transcript_33038/g.63817 Transcript_33038/m.63817 type:complete len:215 (-) Transcript_33038:786-1430(-)
MVSAPSTWESSSALSRTPKTTPTAPNQCTASPLKRARSTSSVPSSSGKSSPERLSASPLTMSATRRTSSRTDFRASMVCLLASSSTCTSHVLTHRSSDHMSTMCATVPECSSPVRPLCPRVRRWSSCLCQRARTPRPLAMRENVRSSGSSVHTTSDSSATTTSGERSSHPGRPIARSRFGGSSVCRSELSRAPSSCSSTIRSCEVPLRCVSSAC